MKNRDGYDVEVSLIEKVDLYEEGGCAITRAEPGWGTFALGKDELNGFVPQVDDVVIVYTKGFSMIRGVVIDGRVIRYQTPEQAAAEFEQWKKNWRLEKLERYVANIDTLKARVEALPTPLRHRMERFAVEGGVEFWIDSAEYEMAVLEGAAALLRKVRDLSLVNYINILENNSEQETAAAVKWIKDWWAINTKEHNYDYQRQMEMVPDFGDGHSGNTAGAAYAFAIAVLEGRDI